MRLKLTLRPLFSRSSITLNYAYYLSAAIYRWIDASSPQYAAFLHDEGFQVEGTLKRFKHFCFSQLVVPRRRVAGGRLYILSPAIDWYIAMPVEASLQHLVVGMFEQRQFHIECEESQLVVEQVETLPDPKWRRRMAFRMLSPVTVSTMHERNSRLVPEYLLSNDPRLNDLLRQNILNKYRSLYGTSPSQSGRLDEQSTEFQVSLDQKFIADRGGPDKISKLITIKQGRADQTKADWEKKEVSDLEC